MWEFYTDVCKCVKIIDWLRVKEDIWIDQIFLF